MSEAREPQFEAVSRLISKEKNIIQSIIERIFLRNTATAANSRTGVTNSGGATR